ncbi:hypothetical protein [Xanthobacter sediminis]
MFIPNSPPPPAPAAPPSWTSRTSPASGAAVEPPDFRIYLPDLTKVSTLGLCHMMDALRAGGDGLFQPAGASGYPIIWELNIGAQIVDTILDAITQVENEVEGELLSRPVPTDPNERDVRARVLSDRHLRIHGIDGSHDLVRRL